MSDAATTETRILVIEDDPLIIHAMLPMLTERGEPLVATTGEQGLQLAEETPNLILLDLNLPDYHGLELIRLLRNQLGFADIPIVVLTGTHDSKTEVQCLEAGASDFLRKPIALPVLDARLKVHLELQQKTQLLANLASLDPLTGLANRRTFESVFERYWALHQRHRTPLSLLFFDLDHFKAINDTYGHSAGDRCLMHAARLLTQIAKRPSDLVCRYGGEEFVVLLPNTSAVDAFKLADRARDTLRRTPVVVDEQTISMTASCGLACSEPEQPESSDELIRRADDFLYRAKNEGRDRVIGEGGAEDG